MDKNKLSFLVYIIVFCASITGVCFFYLGKNFDINVMETGKVPIDREEIQKNEEMINEELNKLFELLNQKESNKKECQLFSTDYLSKFTTYTTEYNFLNDIAPLVMECLYEINYETVSSYKVMDTDNYNKLKKYFNVSLKENDIKDNCFNAYEILEINGTNDYTYKIDDVYKDGNDYKANVIVYKSNVLVSKGSIGVNVIDDHIYYNYFVLNEN